ncbi:MULTISPECIES: hypothetical protein [Chelativorans]|uniref:Uncharacterized protein n=1 Tax=Chelativorans sp. (strain BNC1) TaxID=266779 RepID=Q11CH3_CHESB|nr:MULTISPECIES: hypothetical protein [Chelativorans]
MLPHIWVHRYHSACGYKMEKKMTPGEHDPRHHTRRMKARLQEMVQFLREDIEKVDEPQLKAIFETSAEVLTGLATALDHYEKKSESAWRT